MAPKKKVPQTSVLPGLGGPRLLEDELTPEIEKELSTLFLASNRVSTPEIAILIGQKFNLINPVRLTLWFYDNKLKKLQAAKNK